MVLVCRLAGAPTPCETFAGPGQRAALARALDGDCAALQLTALQDLWHLPEQLKSATEKHVSFVN